MANKYKQPLGYTKKNSGIKKYPESQAETTQYESLIMGDASLVPSNVKNPYTKQNIIGRK